MAVSRLRTHCRVRSEHKNLHIQNYSLGLLAHLDAVSVRQARIENEKIRFKPNDGFQSFCAGARFSDDLKLRAGSQQFPQIQACELVVVCDLVCDP
jgi:hypothetical protein